MWLRIEGIKEDKAMKKRLFASKYNNTRLIMLFFILDTLFAIAIIFLAL